ncbi:54S ribosomal protein L22, mitochondrial [Arachnomyces sp. PD_36]|nr:54S ribosomal protein L22, mitochondrial [Arachnomyces sp. PD_36]
MASLAAALPGRQLTRSARVHLPLISRRTFFSNPSLRNQDEQPQTKKTGPKVSHRPQAPKRGSLGSGSIFDEEDGPKLTTTGRTPTKRPKEAGEEAAQAAPAGPVAESLDSRDPAAMERTLNPHPQRRARWQRKMVIRDIRRRGRLTKQETILRTERESLSKSHWFKSSLKKLGPLARQIAGKNIDDAILQMRFSKKKAAIDVKAHLEHAKNEAMVVRGMGLGNNKEGEDPNVPANKETTKPTVIKLKSGARKTITDPSSIYISQAWVNRGPYGMDLDHRARGVINKLRPPYTGLSVVLKEEKTRIREWQDREAKALRQRKSKLWVHLPDRKISAQRQYYSW